MLHRARLLLPFLVLIAAGRDASASDELNVGDWLARPGVRLVGTAIHHSFKSLK